MNKEVKKAIAIIDEKEGRRREKLAKAEAEKNETSEKLEKVKEAMATAENAEDYKKLLQEKRDLEAIIEFCDKRIKEANGATLPAEEYKAVMMETHKAFNALKNEKRAAIREEIEKLTKLFNSYDTEVEELNRVCQKVATLHRVNPPTLEANSIAGDDKELREFLFAFYRIKSAAAYAAKGMNILS